jgi:hypothetical protein
MGKNNKNRRKWACKKGKSGIVSVEKSKGLFARRISDLLSVDFLILYLRSHRINDRINDFSHPPNQ